MTKSSSFSMVLTVPRAGSEFVVNSYNHENKLVENVFNQHDFGRQEMKIVFCCCGCSS
jgi:hypothetical protein